MSSTAQGTASLLALQRAADGGHGGGRRGANGGGRRTTNGAKPAAPRATGAAGARRFTPEQRAATADRSGSSLLAAGAGSGKTAVMVERFCEAVIRDGVPVGAILALTFTEKAAGELRERIRRRLVELGEDEHARAVDGAWIGTIHGFCARVLRSQSLAAGLDPRFTVLDEDAARRLAAEAFERALDGWAAAAGTPALDITAAYAFDLETMITGAHAELRSRGEARPRLRVPPAAPLPATAALREARARAAAALGAAPGAGKRVAAALEALEACERLLDDDAAVPLPGALEPAKLITGAKALEHADCAAYRETWEALRCACADHHARPVLALLADLLDAFATEYAALKAARAQVDFEDLELRVRDLLAADAALRDRWAARFALVMIDEFQDTNRLQLDVLEALERDNLFAVGDEAQSIYGFRHADVEIFRARRAALDASAVRGLTVNFRSSPEILDLVNGAFAPLLGPGFTPLKAGRPGGELRLFEPGPPADPPVELLVCDTAGWEEREDALGLATLAQQPWRRAEARAVAHRLRAELDAGRRAHDIVVLVRSTSSLRLYEQALEEQGLPTYVLGGRGYWSQAQVRDGLAYLSVLANPLDEAALHATLVSPFCGAGADALVLLAAAARDEAEKARRLGRGAGVGDGGPAEQARRGGCGAGVGDSGPAEQARRGGRVTDREHAVPGGRGGAQAGGGGVWAALQRPGAAWQADLAPAEVERLRAFARFAAGERARAERLPVEVLLERAIAATGYDLAILALPGGDRRLANLRKLMRLAREYERAEGRDLRGFLRYATEQDLAEAREGEAALESEALDAVRLMTIHRAKGLEFPVVCVADLGRAGQSGRPRLLLGRDGSAGLRLATLAGGEAVPALGYDRIAADLAAEEAAEERRLLYVAATRAEERLILSGGADLARPAGWPEARPGGPPLHWLAPALLGSPAAILGGLAEASRAESGAREGGSNEDGANGRSVREGGGAEGSASEGATTVVTCGDGRVLVRAITPVTLPAEALAPAPRTTRPPAPGTALPAEPRVVPGGGRPRPAQRRLSYSSLQDYGRCAYRFYLRRVLGLPSVAPPPPAEGAAPTADDLDPRMRGSLVHALLERLDFARPEAPSAEDIHVLAASHGLALRPGQVADIAAQVGAFAASPLCARLGAARQVRREAGFAFALEPEGGGPLLSGFVDAMAREPDGGVLVVDYKTDRLGEEDPAALVERDYATQRKVYALAALRDGAPRVEVAHCFLERAAEPATATFTTADAPALAAALLDLAGGVLAEEWPVTPRPHRELCGDCPGRASLCSWPEAVTLRPYEESAGTFEGSGGPS